MHSGHRSCSRSYRRESQRRRRPRLGSTRMCPRTTRAACSRRPRTARTACTCPLGRCCSPSRRTREALLNGALSFAENPICAVTVHAEGGVAPRVVDRLPDGRALLLHHAVLLFAFFLRACRPLRERANRRVVREDIVEAHPERDGEENEAEGVSQASLHAPSLRRGLPQCVQKQARRHRSPAARPLALRGMEWCAPCMRALP